MADPADLTDAQQVALLTETTNDLGGDEALPQPPQDPEWRPEEHVLGRLGGYVAGESVKAWEDRARRRASLPLDDVTWEAGGA